MARARVASLWVLNRIVPPSSVWSERPEFYIDESESPGAVPLTGYTDERAANATRDELERKARETTPIGPFLRSRLPDGVNDIVAAARAASLSLPDLAALGPAAQPIVREGYREYGNDYYDFLHRAERVVAAWWATVAADITSEANATLWDRLFPDATFYTVSRVLFKG